ncbi:MAG: endonuclease/exonuclease/phosphatase [Candidatus Aminicenantes bacterium]|nr:endonuclease/exonuclease/phosphatase [Candidatus Aminicenantes bacterium]
MKEYYAAFWNLENLFDVEDSPRRSDKLQRTLKGELTGWTRDVLNKKIEQLAAIIKQMNDGAGPDLMGVCEVENDFVLRLLIDALAPLGRNYDIAHEDMSDRRGIDVGFFYDADLFFTNPEEWFSHYIVKRSATRDIFQVNFRTGSDNLLVVVGNHWPSRSGGQYQTEPFRIIAGETLAYFHERIREIQGDDTAVLVMGDFNDEPHSRSLEDYALSHRTRTKVINARTYRFFNLMWPEEGRSLGSHYYNNVPRMLDQFLVSKGVLTGDSNFEIVDSAEVLRFPEMVKNGDYPVPIRFGRGDSINFDGFSDHFPIALKLKEND